MDKFIKRGLFCMLAAVLLMPAAMLLQGANENVTLALLFLSMILELIGLVFVIISILKRRREQN
jgi:nitrate/nitrite transporter NarK